MENNINKRYKSFTSLEQSKILAEILPLESADMYWWSTSKRSYIEAMDDGDFNEAEGHIRAWSLAALMDVLPSNKNVVTTVSRGGWQMEPIDYLPNVWWCEYEDDESLTTFNTSADNPVDACVAMIIKLHELKML